MTKVDKEVSIRRVIIKEPNGKGQNNNATLAKPGVSQCNKVTNKSDGINILVEGVIPEQNPDEEDMDEDVPCDQPDLANTGMVPVSEVQMGDTAATAMLQGDSQLMGMIDQIVGKRVDTLVEERVQVRIAALTQKSGTFNGILPNIKSPSDTTIYAPAVVNLTPQRRNIVPSVMQQVQPPPLVNVAQHVSEFVEAVRAEAGTGGRSAAPEVVDMEIGVETVARPSTSAPDPPELVQARDRNDRMVVDAEHYKAHLAAPPGNLNLNFLNQNNVVQPLSGVSDDDFFHLMCHVDQGLKEKSNGANTWI